MSVEQQSRGLVDKNEHLIMVHDVPEDPMSKYVNAGVWPNFHSFVSEVAKLGLAGVSAEDGMRLVVRSQNRQNLNEIVVEVSPGSLDAVLSINYLEVKVPELDKEFQLGGDFCIKIPPELKPYRRPTFREDHSEEEKYIIPGAAVVISPLSSALRASTSLSPSKATF